jgi:hypothetical protein
LASKFWYVNIWLEHSLQYWVAWLQGILQVLFSVVRLLFFNRHLYYYCYYIYQLFILVLILFGPPCLLHSHRPLW